MSTNTIVNFTRVATGIDTTPYLEELDAMPQLWLADTSRQRKVRCQRHTRNIFLRAAAKPLPPGASNANDVHECRIIESSARHFPQTLNFCSEFAASEKASLGRATIVALRQRSRVFPHVDEGEYYRIRDRYHLVLQSPSGSQLTAGDEKVVMSEGELWVFNNKLRHSASNPGEEPRVHLIFDLLPALGRGYYVVP
ncbi:MAG: aspartyl/asparaginyl beta-hydroxylase domain-containing protein [Candidatus Tectomicrobia bacterium]|nr:aspartyl/asparaginyl beta-hydroxylase domain-containing protein [Candidatus Tectomicrobia bacterium]